MPVDTEALICARGVHVQAGLELLDTNDTFIEDISDQLLGGRVEYQSALDVHWRAYLDLLSELDWPNIRLRPYQILTAGGVSYQFYLGIYVATTPKLDMGRTPPAYSVVGKSKLKLLVGKIGRSYVVDPGTGYLAALRTLLAARVSGAVCLFDGTAEASVTVDGWGTWLLDHDSPRTYLGGPCADLTKAIAYNPLWCDSAGRFRTEPVVDPATKTPRRTFDVSGAGNADIVDPKRTLETEYGVDEAPNWFRFVRRGMTTLATEGNGQYTVDLTGGGIDYPHHEEMDVADDTALVTEGDKRVQEILRAARVLSITTGPQPDIEHLDVFGYTGDPRVGTAKAQLRSCTIPLKPSDGPVEMTLELLP